MGCDSVARGNVNAQRCEQGIKLGVHHHTVAAVNIILSDGRDCADLKPHAIVEWNITNLFQRTANGFRCKRKIF